MHMCSVAAWRPPCHAVQEMFWGTKPTAQRPAQLVMVGMMLPLDPVVVMCLLECAHVSSQGLLVLLLMDQGRQLTAA